MKNQQNKQSGKRRSKRPAKDNYPQRSSEDTDCRKHRLPASIAKYDLCTPKARDKAALNGNGNAFAGALENSPQASCDPTWEHHSLISNGAIPPAYVRLPVNNSRCPISGLSRSTMNQLILPTSWNNFRAPVRSVVVKSKHATRGARLIDVASLLAYMNSLPNQSTLKELEITTRPKRPKN